MQMALRNVSAVWVLSQSVCKTLVRPGEQTACRARKGGVESRRQASVDSDSQGLLCHGSMAHVIPSKSDMRSHQMIQRQ